MKKKFVIFLCAALMLSGCQKIEQPRKDASLNLINPPQISSSSSSAQSSASSSSVSSAVSPAASSSAQSSVSSSSVASSSPSAVSSASSTSEQKAVSVPAETEMQTYFYSKDPLNPCTITFKDGKVIVNGQYGDLVSDIYLSGFGFDVEYGSSDGLNCTLSLPYAASTQYTTFAILDKNSNVNKIYVKITPYGIELANNSNVVNNNDNVTAFPTNMSSGNVARYITKSGTMEDVPRVLGEIKELSDEICAGIDSDYEKMRAISYWVAENIYYDYNVFYAGIPQYSLTLEHMLEKRSAVCGGYSNMTAALCAAQGIHCLNIKGSCLLHSCYSQTGSGDAHEWNVALLDGKAVIIDTCWNSENVVHTDGDYDTQPIGYKYFDVGKEVFAQDHFARTAEFRDYFALLGE